MSRFGRHWRQYRERKQLIYNITSATRRHWLNISLQVGVHGTKVNLDIERLWPRSISKLAAACNTAEPLLTTGEAISMALVSTHTLPMLMTLFSAGKLNDAAALITHGISSIQQ